RRNDWRRTMKFDDTARFFGPTDKLRPELFIEPSKAATRLCCDCRKVVVEGIRRYCGPCARKRKLASTRESKWRKRSLNGRKTGNSPVVAEALTSAENAIRYRDTPTRVFLPNLPKKGPDANAPEYRATIADTRKSHCYCR